MTISEEEYTLVGPEADGRGLYLDNGFLVKAGSLARKELAPSGKSVSSVHQRLIDEGVLVEYAGQLRFEKDHLFRTPSGAAAAVLGRTANGWTSWKRSDGRTLSDIKRVSRDSHIPLLPESKRQEIIDRHQELMNKGSISTFEKRKLNTLSSAEVRSCCIVGTRWRGVVDVYARPRGQK